MTGGGSGTGKTNFLRNSFKYFGQDFDYNEKTKMTDANFIKIDADDLKARIYEKRNDGKSYLDAGYLHEESSALAKRIQELSLKNNYNTILDSTGDGAPEKLLSKIEDAKSKGYKVEAAYGTCSFENGLKNNFDRWERAVKKGDPNARYVPEEEVVSIHRNVTRCLEEHADKFDKITLSDMNDFNNIKIIANGGNGEKLAIEKGFEKEYNNFVRKGRLTDEQVIAMGSNYRKVLIKKGKRKESDYGE